jgi:hypothetical protein
VPTIKFPKSKYIFRYLAHSTAYALVRGILQHFGDIFILQGDQFPRRSTPKTVGQPISAAMPIYSIHSQVPTVSDEATHRAVMDA